MTASIEKSWELARDILESHHDAIVDDIARECEYLAKRHGSAGNEVLAAIVAEAFLGDCEASGIPSHRAHAAFDRAFPTLALYV